MSTSSSKGNLDGNSVSSKTKHGTEISKKEQKPKNTTKSTKPETSRKKNRPSISRRDANLLDTLNMIRHQNLYLTESRNFTIENVPTIIRKLKRNDGRQRSWNMLTKSVGWNGDNTDIRIKPEDSKNSSIT